MLKRNLQEQGTGRQRHGPFRTQSADSPGVDLAAGLANDAGVDVQYGSDRHGTPKVGFETSGYGGPQQQPVEGAEGFVECRAEKSAVGQPGRSLVQVGDLELRVHAQLTGRHLHMQTGGVSGPTAVAHVVVAGQLRAHWHRVGMPLRHHRVRRGAGGRLRPGVLDCHALILWTGCWRIWDEGENRTMTYREVIRPPWWVFAVVFGLAALLCFTFAAVVGVPAAIVVLVILVAGLGWLLTRRALVVSVDDATLHIGALEVPRTSVLDAVALDEQALRDVAGRDADGRALLVLRNLATKTGVKVALQSSQWPYLLISSRRPSELAAALTA